MDSNLFLAHQIRGIIIIIVVFYSNDCVNCFKPFYSLFNKHL